MTEITPTKRGSLSPASRLSPLEQLGLGASRMLRTDASAPIPGSRPWVPEIRVLERRREIVIRLLTREFDPRRITIQVSGRLLTFSAAALVGPEDPPPYRAFKRSVLLPRNVRPESCSALASGRVLTVRLQKSSGTRAERALSGGPGRA